MGFSASTFGAAKNLVDAITETGKIVIGSGDYQIDYSGNVDNAPVIERAMVALDAIGGGLIELPNKLIPITTFAIRKLIHIRGQGFNSGFINMVDSSATGMITVYHYGITGGHDFYADRFHLSNFTIDGNFDYQTAGTPTATHGLYLTAPDGYFGNGSVPEGLMSGFYNANLSIIENLLIVHMGGHGIYIPDGLTVNQDVLNLQFHNVTIGDCQGTGIYSISSDNNFSNIHVFNCLGGIYINGGNNRLVNIKTFWCINYGLLLDAYSIATSVNNYESQEELSYGLKLNGCDNISLTNVVIESAGITAEDTSSLAGIAISVSGAKNCYINARISNRTWLYGDIEKAIVWGGICVSNKIELQITDPSNGQIRPLPTITGSYPPASNTLVVNGVDLEPVNLFAEIERCTNVGSWELVGTGGVTGTVQQAYNENSLELTCTSHVDEETGFQR